MKHPVIYRLPVLPSLSFKKTLAPLSPEPPLPPPLPPPLHPRPRPSEGDSNRALLVVVQAVYQEVVSPETSPVLSSIDPSCSNWPRPAHKRFQPPQRHAGPHLQRRVELGLAPLSLLVATVRLLGERLPYGDDGESTFGAVVAAHSGQPSPRPGTASLLVAASS